MEYIEKKQLNALYDEDAVTMKGWAMIKQMPTIDIVRCHECMHCDPCPEEPIVWCCKHNDAMMEMSFCSDGEKENRMSRYIDAENAKPIVEKAYHAWSLAMAAADGQREINRVFKMQELCKAVVPVLEHIPTADVREVKKGRWIDFHNAGYDGYQSCSCCGQDVEANLDGVFFYYPFCPYCGAEMDPEVDE